MSVSKEPLSIRNNNPGNLRFANQPGAAPGEGGFARFESPEAGLAAMQRQIELDTQERGLTLDAFLNKYAPPSENKTKNYVDFVVKKTGLDPKAAVPVERIGDLQRAMIEMEGGPRSLSHFMSIDVAQAPKTTPTRVASATTTAPRTTAQFAQAPVASVLEMPDNYRAALAANYLADTEGENDITNKAMQLLEEAGLTGGGTKVGGAKILQEFYAQPSVDPFQFVQAEEEPRRRVVPKMPVRMSNGGMAEVDESMQVNEEDRFKQLEMQRERLTGGLRYQLGPLTGQVVRKPQGYEGRVSTSFGSVSPYMDFDPLSGTFRPTEVGVSTGSMRPEGGYELRFSKPMVPGQDVPPRLTGQYRQQLGRNAEVQASGYYMPIPGAQDQYGANLRYVQRFDKGGEATPADIAEQMTVGTLPEDQKSAGQVFRDIGRDVVRGAQYLPYDLIGAPVDIATMAMRPFGYNVEKPFLGSEYLIDKARQAGIAQAPTGSAAETATRIGMGFVNPAAGARQVGRGIESLRKGAEALELPGIAQTAPTGAVRPLGSAIDTAREVNKLRGASLTELKEGDKYSTVEKIVVPKLENYLTRQFGTINDPLLEATLSGKFLPKSFYKPNDVFSFYKEPVVKVTNIPLKDGETLTMEHVNKLRELSAEGNQEARKLLARAYDVSTYSRGMYTQASLIDELKTPIGYSRVDSYLASVLAGDGEDHASIIKRYISNKGVPDNSISYSRKYDPNSTIPEETVFTYIESGLLNLKTEKAEKLIKEQAGQKPLLSNFVLSSKVNLDDWASSGKGINSVTPTPQNMEELRRGKPVYVPGDPYGGSINYNDLADYMEKTPVEKWSKMSIPELVMASYVNPANVTKPSTIARYADEGIPLLPFQKLMGTKDFMPVKSQVLGNGAEWREITTRDGLRIEGGLLKHCLKKDEFGYCNRLMNKESKYFTLRDADGQPYATIEMSKPIGQENQDVPFNVIKQVKGMSNESVIPLYGEEVSDFLTAWEKQIKTKLRPAENSKYLPPKFRPEEFGIKAPPENMARGGMVDKPLYDRAA